MVDEKETKHNVKHEAKSEHKKEHKKATKIKKVMLWQIATGILAVLLIISIFTHGFLGACKSDAVVKTNSTMTAILLNDARCAECDISSLIPQLKAVFPDLEIKEIDYNTKEGKDIYTKNSIQYLPAILFTEDIKNDQNFAQVSNYIEMKGTYLSLRIGASFDPTKEICDNEIDDNKNGKIDCDDTDCTGSLKCRTEIKKKLDLFVMSQCPYGTAALDAMKEVLENFGSDIDFDIHFIATDNGDGTFSSLHGQAEVDEDMREACAIKYYPSNYKYMDYIWCRNKDIRSTTWESCATTNSMDAAKIKACAEGAEGKALLKEKIKLTDELNIGSSPSWLANNRNTFSGIGAEVVKQNFCTYNKGLKGCENVLSSNETISGNC